MIEIEEPGYPEEYKEHRVFSEINDMKNFYEGISYTCYSFTVSGTRAIMNYASDVYTAIQNTLDSIDILLSIGHINDAYTLVRKYFDDVLVEIYIDAIIKEKHDQEKNFIVKDVDEWLFKKHRIPSLKKLLSIIEKSESTKDIYPFFGWNSYFKHNREILDDSVHSNRFSYMLLNCRDLQLPERVRHLQNIFIVLKQIFTMHLAFMFHLNPHYLSATDYIDSLDCGITPPEGSEYWLAPYAQNAFDKYIKPNPSLASFIKDNCPLDVE